MNDCLKQLEDKVKRLVNNGEIEKAEGEVIEALEANTITIEEAEKVALHIPIETCPTFLTIYKVEKENEFLKSNGIDGTLGLC